MTGAQARYVRERLGLDRETFARCMAVSVRSVSRWENSVKKTLKLDGIPSRVYDGLLFRHRHVTLSEAVEVGAKIKAALVARGDMGGLARLLTFVNGGKKG